MNVHHSAIRGDPSRGRLRTLSGRLQEVTLLSITEDPAGGGSNLTLHLDDLTSDDLIGGRQEILELDLRDGRRFTVVCVGIDLADRIAVFATHLPTTTKSRNAGAEFTHGHSEKLVRPTTCPFCNGGMIDTLARIISPTTCWRCRACEKTWTTASLARLPTRSPCR